MAVKIHRIRVHNPHKARPRKKKKNRKNPARLALLGATNPKRKKEGSMAKRRKKNRKHNPHQSVSFAGRRSRNRRRGNRRGNPHRRRSTNPRLIGLTVDTLRLGLAALVGLVITRQIPQMLLGARNTGIVGYLANIGTGIGASLVADRILPGTSGAVLIGSGLYTVNRGLQEHLSPVGRVLSLSGLGDAMALGEIMHGDRTYFPLPVAYDNDRVPIIPSQIRAAPPPLATANVPMGYHGRRRVSA